MARAPQGALRPSEAKPARVELAPLHELLAVDRRGAGEVRSGQARRDLSTVAYSMPLHVQWRRAFRRHRRLRVMAWSTGLSIVAAILLWQGPRLSAQIGGAWDWAKPQLSAQFGSAWDWARPQLSAALDWAESASGMADGLWLHAFASDELRASERAPEP